MADAATDPKATWVLLGALPVRLRDAWLVVYYAERAQGKPYYAAAAAADEYLLVLTRPTAVLPKADA